MSTTDTRFPAALAEARASGRVLFDLVDDDPAHSGLGFVEPELAAILADREAGPPALRRAEAREAIAGYLAGHGAAVPPRRVVLVRSRIEALRELVRALAADGGEVLVPALGHLRRELGELPGLRPYEIGFAERWRIEGRSPERAVTRRTRAVIAGNPAEPMGAELSAGELASLEALCARSGAALVADEAVLDAALERPRSVATVTRCAAIHLSGLGGVCGLTRSGAEWLAIGGPDELADPLATRLAALEADRGPSPNVRLVPPLLGRREAFLSPLRARLARNRSTLASASLREAPWALTWGGGWWAVLQVNPALDTEELSLGLLAEGVAVAPGPSCGLPRAGHLAVSLLSPPERFDLGLERLEARLRGPSGFAALTS